MGESGPAHVIDESSLLFAANAGSDDISVFHVNADGLELVDIEPSNGMKPVSITVHDGVVYVLNSDGTTDGSVGPLIGQEGVNPSITGFRIDEGDDLTPIPDSTRSLSGGRESGCSQVSFNPTGTVLVVTQRTAPLADQVAGDEGSIDTFIVNAGPSVGNGGTGTGWFVVSNDGTIGPLGLAAT